MAAAVQRRVNADTFTRYPPRGEMTGRHPPGITVAGWTSTRSGKPRKRHLLRLACSTNPTPTRLPPQ